MIIQNSSAANELLVNGAINPNFFGVTSTPSQSKTVTVTPAPVVQRVTVTPPSVVQDGVLVDFPPYTEEIVIQPPSRQVSIPSVGGDLKNTFESVGVINPGGQIRLCALIRPNVIAAAHHYNNPPYQSYIGMMVVFGQQQAKIARVIFTADDFECYQLDSAIATVQPAPIAPVIGDYVGREIIVFGLAGAARPVAGKTSLKYAFINSTSGVGTVNNRAGQPVVVERGDSGSPVFMVANNVVHYLGSLAAMNLTQFQVNIASPHVSAIQSL